MINKLFASYLSLQTLYWLCVGPLLTYCGPTTHVCLLDTGHRRWMTQYASFRHIPSALCLWHNKLLECLIRVYNAFAKQLILNKLCDPFIHTLFCWVKMVSARSWKSLPAEEILKGTMLWHKDMLHTIINAGQGMWKYTARKCRAWKKRGEAH
jgi:hypothetical protein